MPARSCLATRGEKRLFSAVRQLAAPQERPRAKALTSLGSSAAALEAPRLVCLFVVVASAESQAARVVPATASPAPTGLATGPGSGGNLRAHLSTHAHMVCLNTEQLLKKKKKKKKKEKESRTFLTTR